MQRRRRFAWRWPLLAALGLLGLLAGCGGTGGGGVGSLSVTVDGLPVGLDADVRVSAEGRSQTLTGSATLSAWPRGASVVEATPVGRALADGAIVADERWDPIAPRQEVSLASSASVTVSYVNDADVLFVVPTYGGGLVVSGVQELAVTGSARATLLGGGVFTGAAHGPDGRTYVADYDGTVVRVVTLARTATGATATDQGELDGTGPHWNAPLALTFDGDDGLWVLVRGDDLSVPARVLRFAAADVAGVDGPATLSPVATIDLPPNGQPPDATRADIFDLSVDASGRLWIADYIGARVLVYENPDDGAPHPDRALLLGDAVKLTTLVTDDAGRLYLATEAHVARYDDAGTSLPLWPGGVIEADATFSPLEAASGNRPDTLALDASGALWIGYLDGKLARVRSPQTLIGSANVSVDSSSLWRPADVDVAPDFGGNARFIPTVGPLAGF